jgi:hypothetical protein
MVLLKKYLLLIVLILTVAGCSQAQSEAPTKSVLPTSIEINQLIRDGKLEEADKKVNTVLVAKPTSPLAFFYKSLIAFKQKKIKDSEFYLKMAEKKEPHLNFAKNKVLYLQFRKDLYDVIAREDSYNLYKDKDYLKILTN